MEEMLDEGHGAATTGLGGTRWVLEFPVTSETTKPAEILMDSSTIVHLDGLSDQDATELSRKHLLPEAFNHNTAQTRYANMGGVPLALPRASTLITARPAQPDPTTH